jgi:hypothetical protein
LLPWEWPRPGDARRLSDRHRPASHSASTFIITLGRRHGWLPSRGVRSCSRRTRHGRSRSRSMTWIAVVLLLRSYPSLIQVCGLATRASRFLYHALVTSLRQRWFKIIRLGLDSWKYGVWNRYNTRDYGRMFQRRCHAVSKYPLDLVSRGRNNAVSRRPYRRSLRQFQSTVAEWTHPRTKEVLLRRERDNAVRLLPHLRSS